MDKGVWSATVHGVAESDITEAIWEASVAQGLSHFPKFSQLLKCK